MQFVSTIRVQQKHVDELGHLNHVAAVDILQYARDDWYREGLTSISTTAPSVSSTRS
jgi:acyl-CoA thioesterase FadM